MSLSERLGRLLIPGLIGGFLLCLGWLALGSLRQPAIPFLASSGKADWILFPKPPEAAIHKVVPVTGEFQHGFVLSARPNSASISVRMFSQGMIVMNGKLVLTNGTTGANWKRITTVDVAPFLQAGSNFISATVVNATGPPALWLKLDTAERSIVTGPQWQASLAGSVFVPAVRAADPPSVKPGNPLYGRETVASSLRRKWLLLSVLAAIAGVLTVFLPVWRLDATAADGPGRWIERHFRWVLPAGLAVLWLVLFLNNLPQLAQLFGFDRDGHLQYIDYILQQQSLPLADAGWQMYQPPLFYVLSALLIAPFGWAASADGALLLLRGFAALIGLAHAGLIFLCLREIFPGKKSAQLFGAVLAAFLPASLYLSHHVTNENLSALLVTAAFWCLLRLGRPGASVLRWSVLAGLALGLAMLTKFSALLVIPVLLLAVMWKVWLPSATTAERQTVTDTGSALRCGLAFMGVFFLVCGWHYIRVWQHFGNPLIGNWDPRLAFAWWQDPGYRTGSWFTRFGDSLVVPLFSSLSSIADGLFSTLWTDGLCGGSTRMDFRPQWNYDLLNAGLVLGVFWTGLAVVGFWRVIRQNSIRFQAEGLLWLGVSAAFAFGLVYMALRVPSYGQVKFFYALPALLPLCVFATTGWDWLAQRGGAWRFLLNLILVFWVLVVWFGFWIQPANPVTHSVRGIGLADDGRFAEAAESFSRSMALKPNPSAAAGLSSALDRLGRRDEARQVLESALRQFPGEPELSLQLGTILGLQGQYPEAVRLLQQALAGQPDNPLVAQKLAVCLNRSGHHSEAVRACREGLRITPYNPDLHYWLASSAVGMEDLPLAVTHLGWAAQLRQNDPGTWSELGQLLVRIGRSAGAVEAFRHALRWKEDAPDVLNNLAWVLAASPDRQTRDGAQAVKYAERACELTAFQEPVLLGTLAAAYAQAGNFEKAVATAENAAELAATAGQVEVAAKNREYLQLYYSKNQVLP